VIPIPGTTRLPVCSVSGSGQPKIFGETVKISWNLKDNVDAGKITLPWGVLKLLRRL